MFKSCFENHYVGKGRGDGLGFCQIDFTMEMENLVWFIIIWHKVSSEHDDNNNINT